MLLNYCVFCVFSKKEGFDGFYCGWGGGGWMSFNVCSTPVVLAYHKSTP